MLDRSGNPSAALPASASQDADAASAMVARARWLMVISALTTAMAIAAVLGLIGYRIFHAGRSTRPAGAVSSPASFQAFFNTFHLPTPGTPNLDPGDAVIPVPYPNSPATYATACTPAEELWNNGKNPAALAKFTAPTIADGRVILPSMGFFRVYGIATPAKGRKKVNRSLQAAIQQRWLDTGGAAGPLGHPVGDIQRDVDGGGLRQDFQTLLSGGGFGSVSVPPSVKIAKTMCDTPSPLEADLPVAASLFASARTGVHDVIGEIRNKFLQSGRTKQFGYPLTDEVATPDGLGLAARFERGTSYWYRGHNAEIGEPKPPAARTDAGKVGQLAANKLRLRLQYGGGQCAAVIDDGRPAGKGACAAAPPPLFRSEAPFV